MGIATKPVPVKLFAGILIARPEALLEARHLMEERLGAVDHESPVLDFSYTDYYDEEMGPGLKRRLWGFSRLADPGCLADVKQFSNEVERRLLCAGRRSLNVDPGYITAARVVLASTKDFAHRLYLSQGIYGEITLLYRKGGFQALPWTYPDYRSEAYHQFFRGLRTDYLQQLRLSGNTI